MKLNIFGYICWYAILSKESSYTSGAILLNRTAHFQTPTAHFVFQNALILTLTTSNWSK